MAKRRKLETPSAEDLGRIEEEFRRETSARTAKPPIAQVAAEVAGQYQVGTPEMRQNEAQAAAYRKAEGQGLLIQEILLDQIDPLSLQRDRTKTDGEALAELEYSISENGLRLPIEVYRLAEPKDGKHYGLLSGYRRFLAQQNLHSRGDDPALARIKAIVRDPNQMGGAFVAMVEENEIRQDLSHYERGRIAAIAAKEGAFSTTEEAVAHMFAAASKAKRSKIRSFAAIFEELGDVLLFPESLREKEGLKLAQALRAGAGPKLRGLLASGEVTSAKAERSLIEKALTTRAAPVPDPKRGGRPSKKTAEGWSDEDHVFTRLGVMIRREVDGRDVLLRFRGAAVTPKLIEILMGELRDRLEDDDFKNLMQ